MKQLEFNFDPPISESESIKKLIEQLGANLKPLLVKPLFDGNTAEAQSQIVKSVSALVSENAPVYDEEGNLIGRVTGWTVECPEPEFQPSDDAINVRITMTWDHVPAR